jgi:hypothetical protein
MREVFLSSAYFGYVHIYTFNRSILGDSVYASADQARHAGRTDEIGIEARPTPKAGRSWIEQLAAWLRREKEHATC